MNNLTLSTLIIDSLIDLGVEHMVISPGSRSTPLTVAAARNQNVKKTIHYDERGAAFFALGIGKASGTPAVLICTSGTAVANYFPAIVEAAMDNVPLIILSADRPPELIGVGANQSIYQQNIYGRYPRWSAELHPPDGATDPEHIESLLTSMWAAATAGYPGPVHLNCQFREPFFGSSSDDQDQEDDIQAASTSDFSEIAAQLKSRDKGIILVGRSVDPELDELILRLATNLNWPVFPDIQSTLRFTPNPIVINHYDLALLKEGAFNGKPDAVLHLGGAFTSKRLLKYLDSSDPFYIHAKETPECIDPNHQINLTVQSELSDLLTQVDSHLQGSEINTSEGWLDQWQNFTSNIHSLLADIFIDNNELSEPAVSHVISELIPESHTLFLANSMPIRDMEMFGQAMGNVQRIVANRGASGIDGLFASACGVARASDSPLTLVIGDLAGLHDLNSLALVSQSGQPITVVMINNAGGGIFSFLPIADQADLFEPYFGTPHGWQFQKISEMFGLDYRQPRDMNEFRSTYKEALQANISTLIEVSTDRLDNYRLHQEIFQKIRES